MSFDAEFVKPAAAFQESSTAGAAPALPLGAALALREHDDIERVTIATIHRSMGHHHDDNDGMN